MKALMLLTLFCTFAPSAFAETEWERVACRYGRNNIPDDDSGTWCRHYYLCKDQGKTAFIRYEGNGMDRFCCDSRHQTCSPAYSGD